VNIEGAKGFFLSPNYPRFRDHDLVGSFPQPHLVNQPNDGYFVQVEVQASSSNQFTSDMAQIQMLNFSYVDSFIINQRNSFRKA
jgi:hypothetical protein